MATFYQLLGVDVSATSDEIKKAFRSEIARYHPDKVQHLGAEFQQMAAARSASLTEAYRTLMSAELRAAYDAQLLGGVAPPPPKEDAAPPLEARRDAAPTDRAAHQFVEEREQRDVFLRRAAIDRLARALREEFGAFESPAVRGFDLACVLKPRFFPRRPAQRVLGRFVDHVDGKAVTETVMLAARTGPAWTAEELCVVLMGKALAPGHELAAAIGEHWRRPPRGIEGKIVVVPVDVRDWNALIPQDSPALVRALAGRLKSL